jgi:hypothetical protein
MADRHEGRCLCGAVRYEVEGNPLTAGVCHCTFCRRRTGSAFGVGAYFPEASVQIKTGALRAYEYRSDETNQWLRTEFCLKCGTTVTWTAEFLPAGRAIAVGTFDHPEWIRPEWHVWARSAFRWVPLPTDVEVSETIPSRRPG